MDAAGLFPLGALNMPLGGYGFSGNLNDLKDTGCYVIDRSSGEAPSNRPSDYNVAMVLVFGYKAYPCQLYLIAPSLSSDKFIRWYLGGVWSPWIRF